MSNLKKRNFIMNENLNKLFNHIYMQSVGQFIRFKFSLKNNWSIQNCINSKLIQKLYLEWFNNVYFMPTSISNSKTVPVLPSLEPSPIFPFIYPGAPYRISLFFLPWLPCHFYLVVTKQQQLTLYELYCSRIFCLRIFSCGLAWVSIKILNIWQEEI